MARSTQQLVTREKMLHAHLVNDIIGGLLSPTLPKHPGKAYYASIQYTHSLITVNMVSIKSPCVKGQNGHLRIFLTAIQYALVSQVPFVC